MKKFSSVLIVLLFAVFLGGCTGKTTSQFPTPSSVSNKVEQEDSVNFQTSMKLDEVLAFYKSELSGMGLVERELNTVTSDTTFSVVYDGHENGKALVVQGVQLDEKSTNVNVRFEEI